MGDLISRQQAIKSMAEAIWHYPNELYSGLNAYQNAEALAKYGLEHLPSAKYCDNAKIELSKEDLEDLVAQKVKEIKETMSGNWIPCSERLPDEHEWLGTKEFGTTISDEVYVTFETPKGERFCKHLSFQNGNLSDYDQRTIDVFYKGSKPIAWMPLPEPFRPREE